jgi:HEAT repeat protein
LVAQLRSKNASVRAKAAEALGAAGPDAVQHLNYLAATDPEWSVKGAAARSLGRIGPAAKAAVPTLTGFVNYNCQKSLVATAEEMRAESACDDAKRDAKEARDRIQR